MQVQARIQDFAQGGAQLRGARRLGDPRGQRPQGTPCQKPKSLRILETIFLVEARLPFYFLILLFNIILFYHSGRGLGPCTPPPSWIRPCAGRCHLKL